jgi:hypothetical protein
MNESRTGLEYVLLFLPYVVAELLSQAPLTSYLIAWGGSFWIFYLSLSGTVKPLPDDRSFARQIFRPLGLTQLLFAGHNAVTSIFYVLSLHGYTYFTHNPYQPVPPQEIAYAAGAQRYFVLAHAAFTAGVLLLMNYRQSGRWRFRTSLSLPRFMLVVAGGTFVMSLLLQYIPGLGQVQIRFSTLALVAAVLSFALSIRSGDAGLMVLNGGIYAANMMQAFLSGWKEEVLVVFLLLAMFLYPFYRKAVSVATPIGLAVLLFILPTYASVFRSLNWSGQASAQQAAAVAYQQISTSDAEAIWQNNWSFLTGRATLIGLFTDYMRKVPSERDYYGLTIPQQSVMNLVPRVFWPGKPVTENLVMQRAYENEVISEKSSVSAKPTFIMDGYLSYGALGVFLSCLVYGLLASLASRLAERWFGGYLIGSGVVYTALFRDMWVGNAFEFFFNSILWSFIIMFALFVGARLLGILVPAETRTPASSPAASAT